MRKNSKVIEAFTEIASSLPLVSVHSVVMGMRNGDLTEHEELFLLALKARIDKEQEAWLEGNAWREFSRIRKAEVLAQALARSSKIAELAQARHTGSLAGQGVSTPRAG
jgi:hypothetical protein